MNRTRTRSAGRLAALALAATLLAPREGQVSGSTRVEAATAWFLLVAETPRRIFREPRQEGEDHRDARARLGARVSALVPRIEELLAQLRGEGARWRLRKYDATLPAVHDTDQPPAGKRAARPCRYVLHLDPSPFAGALGTLEVAFDRPPPRRDADELKQRLQRVVEGAVGSE